MELVLVVGTSVVLVLVVPGSPVTEVGSSVVEVVVVLSSSIVVVDSSPVVDGMSPAVAASVGILLGCGHAVDATAKAATKTTAELH